MIAKVPKRQHGLALLAAIGALTMASPAGAQAFEPHAGCKTVLKQISGNNAQLRTVALVWGFGYLAAQTGKTITLAPGQVDKLLPAIKTHCKSNKTTYAQAVHALAKAQRSTTRKEEADGEKMLMTFLDPAADTRKLTLSLKPSAKDIKAIFKEPMASRLAPYLEQMFAKGKVAPKPGQTRLISMFTTTSHLIGKQPVLAKFPGGYKKVLKHLKPKIVVAQFRFVKPDETRGMAFDGLYHVNGRWVLIPKPWRVLE